MNPLIGPQRAKIFGLTGLATAPGVLIGEVVTGSMPWTLPVPIVIYGVQLHVMVQNDFTPHALITPPGGKKLSLVSTGAFAPPPPPGFPLTGVNAWDYSMLRFEVYFQAEESYKNFQEGTAMVLPPGTYDLTVSAFGEFPVDEVAIIALAIHYREQYPGEILS